MKSNHRQTKRARAAKSYHNESEDSDNSEFDSKPRKLAAKSTKANPRSNNAVPEVASPQRATRSQDRRTIVERSASMHESSGGRKKSSRTSDRSEENDLLDQEASPAKKPRTNRNSLASKSKKVPEAQSVTEPWPDIDLKWISQVSISILERLVSKDRVAYTVVLLDLTHGLALRECSMTRIFLKNRWQTSIPTLLIATRV